MQLRRETGQFFTPADIASFAHAELLQVVPDAYENWNWWIGLRPRQPDAGMPRK